MLFLAAKAAAGALAGARLVAAGARAEREVQHLKQKLDRRLFPAGAKENEIIMKKSTFGAMVVGLAAATGALAAGAIYLYRREKELDEYEKLLFSDEFNDSVPDEKSETAPAEEAEEDEPEVEVEISLQPADSEEKPVEEEPKEEAPAEDEEA